MKLIINNKGVEQMPQSLTERRRSRRAVSATGAEFGVIAVVGESTINAAG